MNVYAESVNELDQAGRDALDGAARGDADAAARFIARYRASDDPVAAAWISVLRAAEWCRRPEWDESARPSIDAASAMANNPRCREALLRLGEEGAKACALAFDVDGLTRWRDLARGSPRVRAWASLAGLERADSSSDDVECAAIAAIAALEEGELSDGLAGARKTTRQSRSRGIGSSEFLAHLALARARRLTGRPHLALLIASEVERVAPRPWHTWTRWEIVMAGGTVAGEDLATELADLAAAARAGDAHRFKERHRRLHIRTASFPMLAADVETIETTCSPEAPGTSPWRRGEVDAIPARVLGLSDGEAGAFVLASPARAARLLSIAAKLVPSDYVAIEAGEPGKGRRPIAALAALALAGARGVATPVLFERVYGFAYDPALHRAVFDTLLHRARALAGALGTIRRSGDSIVLEVARNVLIPDPRCARPLEDRVLRVLARAGGCSADGAAHALDVPSRTVSRALRSLVEEGACRVVRDGRAVRYEIEDTAFSEVTLRTSA